jgi:hypothetical protein
MINAEAAPVAVSQPLVLADGQAWQDAYTGMPCATQPPTPALTQPADRDTHDRPSPMSIAPGGPDAP